MNAGLRRFLMMLFGDIIPELINIRRERKAAEKENEAEKLRQEQADLESSRRAGARAAEAARQGLENERKYNTNRR